MKLINRFDHDQMTFTLTEMEHRVKAPGKGSVFFHQIAASQSIYTANESIEISADVEGENIAHMYAEALLYDKQERQLYGPVHREFIIALNNTVVNGTAHPEWGNSIRITQTFKMQLPVLTAGDSAAFGFALPQTYSPDERELTYQVNGLYSITGSQPIRARAQFDHQGNLTGLIGSQDRGKVSTPKAITPGPGDSFTPLVRRLGAAAPGEAWPVEDFVQADTLSMATPIRRERLNPLPGHYFVGFIVEDFDGTLYRKYVPIQITG
jgi:hypothetical protein